MSCRSVLTLVSLLTLCAGGCSDDTSAAPLPDVSLDGSSLLPDGSADGSSGADANCPHKRTDTSLYDDSFGTLRFTGELLVRETCGEAYCFVGAVVGMFRITAVIDDCQKLSTARGPAAALQVGDEVPIVLTESAMGKAMQVGERADVACVIYPACADGCKPVPPRQIGPCFASEYGCRTRCHEPLLSPPS